MSEIPTHCHNCECPIDVYDGAYGVIYLEVEFNRREIYVCFSCSERIQNRFFKPTISRNAPGTQPAKSGPLARRGKAGENDAVRRRKTGRANLRRLDGRTD